MLTSIPYSKYGTMPGRLTANGLPTQKTAINTVKPETSDKKKESSPVPKKIDLQVDIDGIEGRIGKLPIKASNYFNLTSVENKLYYQRRGPKDDKTGLFMYDFDSREEKNLGQVDGYEISANKKKMIVSQNGLYGIINVPATEIKITDKLDLSGLLMVINKQEEWEQIYKETWRQMRDFFYSPNMNGVDWKAQGDKYEAVSYTHLRAH